MNPRSELGKIPTFVGKNPNSSWEKSQLQLGKIPTVVGENPNKNSLTNTKKIGIFPKKRGKKMSANAENTLTSLVEQLQDKMDNKNSKLYISTGRCKPKVINEFVLMFASVFLQTIDDYKLTRNDIRVVLKIIEYAQYGNLLRLSYTTIAKDLNIDKGDISKSIKRIKASELIVDIEGSLYLNPHIICKGRFNISDDKDEEILNKSADALQGSNRKPSIETKYIKNKLQQMDLLGNNKIQE